MTYRILLVAKNPTRDMVLCVAGCDDEDDARRKTRLIVEVERFKKIEPVR